MPTRHTGPHALHQMEVEYHYHPFGDEHLAAQRMVQPLPAAFDAEKRLDYDVRTDEQPVYVAFGEYQFNSDGTVAPNTTTDTWIIQKFTYDQFDRLTRIECRRGAWDERTTLF